jgi:hypothetical protein
MNCSRCQADLPDSATFCPRCGTSTPPGQPGFSYLPAGTPPWPSTVPQKNPYYSQSASAVQSAESSTTRPEKKSGRSGGSVLLAIGVIILVPLIGALATIASLYAKGTFPPDTSPQPRVILPAKASPTQAAASTSGTPTASSSTQGNQLPTPTSQRTINSSDLNMSLKYPSTWITDPANKSTDSISMAIHPQQALGIGFVAIRFSDATSASITSPDEINQAQIQTVKNQQGISNLQVVPSSADQPKIGGDTWKQLDAVFQNSNGTKIHMISISELHKKTYYNLIIFSPDGVYSEAMQKYIQPILDSLQFLS